MTVKGSGHRERQAEATKDAVAAAARTLFTERGYTATTVKAISEAAEIPEQTIYSALGSKKQILGRITELWMRESRTAEIAEAYFEEPDPAERLRMFVSLHRRQLDVGADVIAIHREAARADADMAALLARILGAREGEIRKLLVSIGDSLVTDVEEALDLTLALTLDDLYATLRSRGWSSDAYEAWLARTLLQQLLG